MNILPEPWVLSLTQEETNLYHNLAPDYESGAFASEFLVKMQFDQTMFDADQLRDFINSATMNGCVNFSIEIDYDYDGYATAAIHAEGIVPLLEDEKVIYDSLMEKIRNHHKTQIKLNISELEAKITELKADLENFVW